MKPPRTRLLGRVCGLPVYLVDGESIRNEIDIEFTQGANEGAYPNWCPKNEIWIDDAIHGSIDLMATTYHEVVERELMKHGWTYSRAHDVASKMEIEFRRELAKKRPRAFSAKTVERKIREARS